MNEAYNEAYALRADSMCMNEAGTETPYFNRYGRKPFVAPLKKRRKWKGKGKFKGQRGL